MNKPSKCKNCQWYGKPYWSIINPCDNCPNENNYKTIITIDREPLFKEVLTEEEIKKAMTDKSIFEITLEEKDKEIERLNNRINNALKYIQHNCVLSDRWEDLGFCEFVPTGKINYKPLSSKKVKELFYILLGGNND